MKQNSAELDFFDLQDNLNHIQGATMKADYIVVSAHVHQGSGSSPPDFLVDLAKSCIDAGADIFFAHGSHFLRGMEIYKNRPIFYGLGNFVFQSEHITKQPSEFYDRLKLDKSTTLEEAYDKRSSLDNGLYSRGWTNKPEYWQTVTPVVTFKGDSIFEIKLIPVNLLFGEPKGVRGRPVLADRKTGRAIISNISTLSQRGNVQIRYNEEENVGIIQF